MLVGRERELLALDEAIAAAGAGRSVVVMLSGEPGIGKTRLLDELATRARGAGAVAAWGRTWEVGLTPPFWPWLEILRALETDADRAPRLGGLDQRADATTRLALFDEIARFLGRRTASGPLALLIDDLHAADLSTLQLLDYLVARVEHAVFGLATRDGDAPSAVASAVGRIQRVARRLALPRLGRDDVYAMVGGLASSARIWELSEGNPLFVEELVAVPPGDALRLPNVSSVRTLIRQRVAQLPAASGRALVAAAVVGREFRGQLVAEMLELAELGDALLPALRLGVISSAGIDRYRFSHALVAESIADDLEPGDAAQLHVRAARAIERRGVPDDAVTTIAHHLLAAGSIAAADAVVAAERAADAALHQLAFEDAHVLLSRALEALALAAPGDRSSRARLLCGQAEALQHAEEHVRAARLCDDAAAISRALGDGDLLARIALVRGLEARYGRTDPLLVDALREALSGVEHATLRAKLLARLAAAEQPAADPRGPIARAHEAIELARALPARDRLDVMYVAIAALIDYVPLETLEPLQREVLELARGVDRKITVHSLLRLCFSALARIDRAGYEVAVAAFAAEAVALGLPQWTRQVEMLAAMTAVLDGRFADSERHATAAEASARGNENVVFPIRIHRVLTRSIRAQPVSPEDEATVAMFTPGLRPTAAWLATRRGDRDQARAALALCAPEAILDPPMCVMIVQAVAFVGDRERAAWLYDLLQDHAGSVVIASLVGMNVFDLYDRMLVVLAAATEHWDAIDSHAERALDVAHRLASPVWIAHVRADWADALERRARDGDRERSTALRAAARSGAERLGMPGLVARCDAAAPSGRTARGTAPRDRLMFERTGELWIVSGLGERVHVKDSRGVQMLARLTAEPGRELHALDLGGGGDAIDGGDAGAALDDAAKRCYRARLAELMRERDQADTWADRGRTERIAAEIEALTVELERAVGMGGRDRKLGAAAERARSNVQRRIQHAVQQIRAASPRLGDHLAATIATGVYCSYDRD